MGFLGFGKKKASEPVSLKDYLSEEETGMLAAELQTLAKRVPGEASGIAAALAETILEGGTFPGKEGLGMCLSAIRMNQSFGESQEGSAALLGKLADIEKTIKSK